MHHPVRGQMVQEGSLRWGVPRYGRHNAHIYPSYMQHPYDSYIRAPMPYPYASQGMYHTPQGGPPSHYGYTPQMPSYPGQYGWTYMPGTHSLPTQGGGGSHVPPHPYSPGSDMSCYSPQIPGDGFGPRHPMNHTAPGCGVQPQTAPEMAAQLSLFRLFLWRYLCSSVHSSCCRVDNHRLMHRDQSHPLYLHSRACYLGKSQPFRSGWRCLQFPASTQSS